VKYSVGTQQRRKTLGAFVPGAQAGIRKEAAEVLAQARLGKDVVGEARKAQEKAAKQKTLGELDAPYLELRATGNEFWKALRPQSHSEATRYLEESWKPLHEMAINEITRQMVRDRRNEIVSESGAVSADGRWRRFPGSVAGLLSRNTSLAPTQRATLSGCTRTTASGCCPRKNWF